MDHHLFIAPCYRKDMERLRFVLCAYVRARLAKIQRQAGHILGDAEALARLSPRERKYCRHYLGLCAKHHQNALLRDLPDPFKEVPEGGTEDSVACTPALAAELSSPTDLDAFVFARVKHELGDVIIDEASGQSAYLGAGDIHVLRYRSIRRLVHGDDLELF